MHCVYSSPDPAMVHLVRNALENRDIICVVRGEHLAGASGGIAPIDAWAELWVLGDADVEEAREIVAEIIGSDEADEAETWTCLECGEVLEGQFGACWNCGAPRRG